MPKALTEVEATSRARSAGLKPLEPYPGMTHMKWRCLHLKCGNEVTPTVLSMKSGPGCKTCQYQENSKRSRKSADEAVAEMRAGGYEPLEPYQASSKPWRSRCLTCATETRPLLNNVNSGHGCAHCYQTNRRDLDPAFTGAYKNGLVLSETEALERLTAADYMPLEPYPNGGNRDWRVECGRCGETVRVKAARVKRAANRPCRHGRYYPPVKPEEAVKVMKAASLEPLEPYPGRNSIRWRCLCNACGEECAPCYNSIQSGQGGCSVCAERGLRQSEPTFVYVAVNDHLGAIKVGVTNISRSEGRFSEHALRGWEIIQTWPFSTGITAEAVEAAALRWWRNDLEAPEGCLKDEIRRGYTETAPLILAPADLTIRKINELAFTSTREL